MLWYLFAGVFSVALLAVVPLYLISSIIDLSLWVLRPYERRQGDVWVEKASSR